MCDKSENFYSGYDTDRRVDDGEKNRKAAVFNNLLRKMVHNDKMYWRIIGCN